MAILEVLARRVAERGEHVFVRFDGRALSYRDFDACSNAAAHALQAAGVVKGDRVTLALGSSLEFVVAAFAALKAGAILNPINPTLGDTEIGWVLGHAEPRVVVTDAESDETMRRLDQPTMLATALAAGDDTTPVDVLVGENDYSTLLYTSGTTGRPKGVLFTHGRTGTSGPHFIEAMELSQDDIILAVTPLFHGNAWGSVVTALFAGATSVFTRAFHGSQFWQLVHDARATVLYTLGTVLAMLLTREPTDLERENPLRIILGLGSAPIRDRVIERFGVRDVLECFGSTDAGVVTITPRGAPARAGSCGPAVSGVRLKIVDDAGTELPVGAVGEIAVHSPGRVASYFRDEEATTQAVRDGWFHTGDLGYLDEDGWLYFVDRKRDVIRRGGENVSSVLVEKTLREHPRVLEAAVIGVPEPVLGQEIKACLVTSEPVSEDDVRAFAAARLANFQVPRLWEFRDSLPKTPTQRVEKYKLRQEHDRGKPLLR